MHIAIRAAVFLSSDAGISIRVDGTDPGSSYRRIAFNWSLSQYSWMSSCSSFCSISFSLVRLILKWWTLWWSTTFGNYVHDWEGVIRYLTFPFGRIDGQARHVSIKKCQLEDSRHGAPFVQSWNEGYGYVRLSGHTLHDNFDAAYFLRRAQDHTYRVRVNQRKRLKKTACFWLFFTCSVVFTEA